MSTVTLYKHHICTSRLIGQMEGDEYYSFYPFGPDDEISAGFDDGGHEYELPEGCEVGETWMGETAVYRGDEHVPITTDAEGRPVAVLGSDLIPLKAAGK